jgi:hypothetical protein
MTTTAERMARVEALVAELEAAPASPTRETARELLRVVLELHRGAFRTLLQRAGDRSGLEADEEIAVALSIHGMELTPAEAALVPAERLVRRAEPPAATLHRCERCGEGIADEHDHALVSDGTLMCVCARCALGGVEPRIRARSERARDVSLGDAVWNALEIPVALAFFVRRRDGSLVARYPGPAGLCETEVAPDAWRALAGNAVLEPEVEALLVHRLGEARAAYRVSIDRCHALAGVLRTSWRGLAGGPEARRALTSFFDDLERREVASA